MTHRLFPLAALALAASSAHAAWYTDETSFLAAIDAVRYTETFDGWTYGNPLNGYQASWSAPGANGYGWTAAAPQGLWSNVGSLSTNNASDNLLITFNGKEVTAFGAYLSTTDFNGNTTSGNVSLALSNGQSQTVFANNVPVFLGWVGADVLTTATLDAEDGTAYHWIQADNVTVGAPVPEPASMAVLGLGLAALRRRRKSA